MNRTAFFNAIRSPLFSGSFSQSQTDGLTRLLDVWFASYAATGSAGELAYNLGTSFHETAKTMQPIIELGKKAYFDKYEPGTKIGKALGNTVAGDGYRFRGQGDVQNTGRRNASVASKKLKEIGIEVDLVANPEKRGDPVISAHSLFLGNRQGWWTSRKLGDYIDGIDEDDDEDFREYVASRAVVNGSDKAKQIAEYALAFEKALALANYEASAMPVDAPKPEPATDAAQKTPEQVQSALAKPMVQSKTMWATIIQADAGGGATTAISALGGLDRWVALAIVSVIAIAAFVVIWERVKYGNATRAIIEEEEAEK